MVSIKGCLEDSKSRNRSCLGNVVGQILLSCHLEFLKNRSNRSSNSSISLHNFHCGVRRYDIEFSCIKLLNRLYPAKRQADLSCTLYPTKEPVHKLKLAFNIKPIWNSMLNSKIENGKKISVTSFTSQVFYNKVASLLLVKRCQILISLWEFVRIGNGNNDLVNSNVLLICTYRNIPISFTG